ncbi:MAG TPA: carboxymuconolactone decarboxylase family protein [Polyangiales bacterium]|nr:carboxymuconolactone decarboxylase family protein [Polyangiales bacterium]
MNNSAVESEHGTLPLAPIARPHGLFVRALYHMTQRRYGKTPTAFRVIYARAPAIAFVSVVIGSVLEFFLRIDRPLRTLIQLSVATYNGCTFCLDLNRAEAARAKIGHARFDDLHDFESSDRFSVREKAALAYVRALHDSMHVGDDVWRRLGEQFDERERVEIVWLCAVERYFNSMALPLRIGSDHLSD